MSHSAFLPIQDYQLHYQLIGNFAPQKPLLVFLHEGLGALPALEGLAPRTGPSARLPHPAL